MASQKDVHSRPHANKAGSINRRSWLPVVLDFCSRLTIDSKETGVGPLKLYRAQRRFLEEICEGLDRGIRYFLVLKARQLGISTVSLALDLLWLSVHEGTQGALVVDNEGNREKFRVLLERYINSLPRGLRVGIKTHNRNGLVLNNGSNLDYLVAGTKRGNTTLGQSRALSCVHGTEVGSWGSEEGLASLVSSLAERNPNRFYLFESTAHGFNMWFNMWQAAQHDDLNKKCIFVGWYDKDIYSLDPDSRQFARYWNGELDELESDLVSDVKRRFGIDITPEQIAWHRQKRTEDIPDEDMMNQNFPWTPEMAFITTGHGFFPAKRMAEDIKFVYEEKIPLKAYRYQLGETFTASTMEPVNSTADADLRIWEEPNPNGVYVMGVDPAYGRSDEADSHAIQVFRCYADKLVQVAEYATTLPETYQIAWVMCHLAGAYSNVRINLEVTGPGAAIKLELNHLKQLLYSGLLPGLSTNMNLMDMFSNVKYYLYHRVDSMGPGYVYFWKTSLENKMRILNQLRDNYTLRMIRVRSVPLLKEMQRVTQKGSDISAEGTAHDDLVFASALACTAWAEWVRNDLIATNQTYENVSKAERNDLERPSATMVGRFVESYFKGKEEERAEREDAAIWGDLQ